MKTKNQETKKLRPEFKTRMMENKSVAEIVEQMSAERGMNVDDVLFNVQVVSDSCRKTKTEIGRLGMTCLVLMGFSQQDAVTISFSAGMM